MRNPNYTSVAIPWALADEIDAIARDEGRKKYAVVERAIDLYRQATESEPVVK